MAAAVPALLVSSSARSKPASDDCALAAYVFVYYGGDTEAQGRVECSSQKAWIGVSAVVTRDGTLIASGEHRCRKATRCRITFAPLPDPDGDQRWCVDVTGEIQGGLALGSRTFCEEFTDL